MGVYSLKYKKFEKSQGLIRGSVSRGNQKSLFFLKKRTASLKHLQHIFHRGKYRNKKNVCMNDCVHVTHHHIFGRMKTCILHSHSKSQVDKIRALATFCVMDIEVRGGSDSPTHPWFLGPLLGMRCQCMRGH